MHNGIIENHSDLRAYLKAEGIKFSTQTDTEVIAHLIRTFTEKGQSFEKAVFNSIKKLKGAYALGIIDKKNPEQIIESEIKAHLCLVKDFKKTSLPQM